MVPDASLTLRIPVHASIAIVNFLRTTAGTLVLASGARRAQVRTRLPSKRELSAASMEQRPQSRCAPILFSYSYIADLRTTPGSALPRSYKNAAVSNGFVNDDHEHEPPMQEATALRSASRLCELLAYLPCIVSPCRRELFGR